MFPNIHIAIITDQGAGRFDLERDLIPYSKNAAPRETPGPRLHLAEQ